MDLKDCTVTGVGSIYDTMSVTRCFHTVALDARPLYAPDSDDEEEPATEPPQPVHPKSRCDIQ